jgi:hypothetical protein
MLLFLFSLAHAQDDAYDAEGGDDQAEQMRTGTKVVTYKQSLRRGDTLRASGDYTPNVGQGCTPVNGPEATVAVQYKDANGIWRPTGFTTRTKGSSSPNVSVVYKATITAVHRVSVTPDKVAEATNPCSCDATLTLSVSSPDGEAE